MKLRETLSQAEIDFSLQPRATQTLKHSRNFAEVREIFARFYGILILILFFESQRINIPE